MRKAMWYVWVPIGIVLGVAGTYIGVVIYLSKGIVFGRRR